MKLYLWQLSCVCRVVMLRIAVCKAFRGSLQHFHGKQGLFYANIVHLTLMNEGFLTYQSPDFFADFWACGAFKMVMLIVIHFPKDKSFLSNFLLLCFISVRCWTLAFRARFCRDNLLCFSSWKVLELNGIFLFADIFWVEFCEDWHECSQKRPSSHYSLWTVCICCIFICLRTGIRNNYCCWYAVYYPGESVALLQRS